jgi:peroxiredoxin
MKKYSIVLLLAIFMGASTPQYEIGDVIRDFSLKNVDGKMVSLSDFKKSKGVILVFDCNTCPVSKGYNSRIIALSKKYKSEGFPLIAINANDPGISPGDSYEHMIEYARAHKYDFPYLVDQTQNIARAFGATNTPHVYVLQRDGENFKLAYIGAIDNNSRDESAASKKYVEEAVDAILANKAVATPKTKAIGCGIKYRNS